MSFQDNELNSLPHQISKNRAGITTPPCIGSCQTCVHALVPDDLKMASASQEFGSGRFRSETLCNESYPKWSAKMLARSSETESGETSPSVCSDKEVTPLSETPQGMMWLNSDKSLLTFRATPWQV